MRRIEMPKGCSDTAKCTWKVSTPIGVNITEQDITNSEAAPFYMTYLTTREMAGIFAQEIEARDFSGAGLNVSYRIHSIKAAYRNKKTSSEGHRF